MMKNILTFALTGLLTVTISAQVQIDRTKAPTPGPAPKISIGKAEKFVLKMA